MSRSTAPAFTKAQLLEKIQGVGGLDQRLLESLIESIYDTSSVGPGAQTQADLDTAEAILASIKGKRTAQTKTSDGASTLLAAHATTARTVLVLVTVDEVFANGTGTQTAFTLGVGASADSITDGSDLVDAAAGATFMYGAAVPITEAVTITATPATGTGTGGVTVTVIGVPSE